MNNLSKELQPDPLRQTKFPLGLVYVLIGIAVMLLFTYGLYLLVADQPPSSEQTQTQVQARSPTEKPVADRNSSDALTIEKLEDDLFDEPELMDETGQNVDASGAVSLDLDHSDPRVRELVSAQSSEPALKAWLSVDHLLRRFVTLVDNIQRGSIPRKQLAFLAPQGRFKVAKSTGYGIVIDPVSYQKYNVYADTLVSLDTTATVDLYLRLRPLIIRAYEEIGKRSGDFDQVLSQAIEHLLATPILEGEVALIRPSVMYKFKDKEIEGLSSAQKQLIRTGPRNTRIIQQQLAAFASAIKQSE